MTDKPAGGDAAIRKDDGASKGDNNTSSPAPSWQRRAAERIQKARSVSWGFVGSDAFECIIREECGDVDALPTDDPKNRAEWCKRHGLPVGWLVVRDEEIAIVKAEVERLRHERDALGESLGRLVVAAGVMHANAWATGPQLLLMADEAAKEVERLRAELRDEKAAHERALRDLAWAAAFAAVQGGYPRVDWAEVGTLAEIATDLNDLLTSGTSDPPHAS